VNNKEQTYLECMENLVKNIFYMVNILEIILVVEHTDLLKVVVDMDLYIHYKYYENLLSYLDNYYILSKLLLQVLLI